MNPVLALLMILAAPFSGIGISRSAAEVSRSCGADFVGYLIRSRNGFLLFVNGEQIDDQVLMCEALSFYIANRCLESDSQIAEWGEIGEKYCGRGLEYTAGLNRDALSGRKLLLQPQVDSSSMDNISKSELNPEQFKGHDISVLPTSTALAVPGMFLVCCVVICPCFRARKKEPIEQKALAKEPNLSELVTMGGSASSVRNLTIQKVAPSSRFSLSPQPSRIDSLELTLSQIAKATQNFSPSMKLGEGGFGTVYKGVLNDGQFVSIKRAKKDTIDVYLGINEWCVGYSCVSLIND